jgi:hypothetical protein
MCIRDRLESLTPSPSSPVNVGTVSAIIGSGAIVSSNITLISVRDGNNVNLDSFYDIIADPSGGNEYILRATDGCVFLENSTTNASNQRIFTFQVQDTQTGNVSNLLTNIYSYTTSIGNAVPSFAGFGNDNNGWPNNPVGIINLTDYLVNQYSIVPSVSVIGAFSPSFNSQGQTQAKADSRIYFKNGSGADFFSLGISDNEFSEVIIEMQVSRTDSSQGGGATFTAMQSQNVPVNGFIATSNGTTINNGVISTNAPVVSTGVGASGNLLTNSAVSLAQNTGSTTQSGTRAGSLKGYGGTTSISTATIEVFDGFYLTQAGTSDSIYTPASYSIPDNVPAYIVGWYGGYYVSENPSIRDNAGNLLTDTTTGQPYVENGGVAAAQDFNLNWLKERYIRFIIKDANGSQLGMTQTIGTNVIGQDGIKVEFNIVGTPLNGVIRSYGLSVVGGVQQSCGTASVGAGFSAAGGTNSNTAANSTDEGQATGNNQTGTATVPAQGNNPYVMGGQAGGGPGPGQVGALGLNVNDNN